MTSNLPIILFEKYKETNLYGRYICLKQIRPLIDNLPSLFTVETLGVSVLGKEIKSIEVGKGPIKVFIWSQMHGNESTTTKALFDLLQFLKSDESEAKVILKSCTLKIIPILNPDGAESYTRVNANNIDLNRDAQNLTQPESLILRTLFNQFKPDYCFNLHGQRTIFSAGTTNKPATVSFLSPSQDNELSLTMNRKKAMEIIAVMNGYLQKVIPDQVGIYDDAFNLNCVGDTFQSLGVPTILFEAGHFPGDYHRETTRKYIFCSYLTSLIYISTSKTELEGNKFSDYFKIPMNNKLFYDIIIRNTITEKGNFDIGIQFQELLKNGKVIFLPKIEKIDVMDNFFGHYEIDANNKKISTPKLESVWEGYENDFVLINNEKIQLNLIKS